MTTRTDDETGPRLASTPAPLGKLLGIAVALGAANSLGLLGFEWVTEHLQHLIWLDWANTDERRWLVLPLAIAGSVGLSLTLRTVRQPRLQATHTDFLAEAGQVEPSSLKSIGILLLVGVVSLVGGASLGPEGAILPASVALGAWYSGRSGSTAGMSQVLVLSSVGALLVSFFGSLIPAPLPLLMLRKQGRQLTRTSAVISLIAAATAWALVSVIRGESQGPQILPVSSGANLKVGLTAMGLGALAVVAGVMLRSVIRTAGRLTERIDKGWNWILGSSLFGAVIGILYWAGGESVQFSGHLGTHMLYEDRSKYGIAALLALLAVKMLVTGWSVASGYRGGMAFPAVYMGVALGLAATAAFPGLPQSGTMIGALAGILAEMTSPIVAVIIVLSLMPLKLLPIGLAGALGAVAGRRGLEMILPRPRQG